jgi:hypothetical protein
MSAWSVQKAVYARLQPVLAALSPAVAIYDAAPTGAAYPFVEFARHILNQADGFDYEVTEDQITLAVYSDYAGQKQVLDILAAIRTELHDARLVLDTGQAISCRYQRADTARDQDGVTYTGTILFFIPFEEA